MTTASVTAVVYNATSSVILVFVSRNCQEFQLHSQTKAQQEQQIQREFNELVQELKIQNNVLEQQQLLKLLQQGYFHSVGPCESLELKIQNLTFLCIQMQDISQQNSYLRGWNIPITSGNTLIVSEDLLNHGKIDRPWIDNQGTNWLEQCQEKWLKSGIEETVLRLIIESIKQKGMEVSSQLVADAIAKYPGIAESVNLQKIIHQRVSQTLEEQSNVAKVGDLDSAAGEYEDMESDYNFQSHLQEQHNVEFSKALMPRHSLSLAVQTAAWALERYPDDDEHIVKYICNVFDKRYTRRSWHCITGTDFHWKGQFQSNHLADFTIDGRRFIIFSTV
eukprot:TRINITY_DN1714_c0_g1_i1.p1 TRINITY_DN1714_c0_g1~~TRINITY_DN1714_c0_g1_i1.p1  ORF type:complete len:334 (+),score=20.31 TRINITY_DN1714_c0_g1_i1:62-1063(+)